MRVVCVRSSVAIKKGRSDGKTEFANKSRPVLDACRLFLEKTISPIVNRQNIAGIIFLFNEIVNILKFVFFIYIILSKMR